MPRPVPDPHPPKQGPLENRLCASINGVFMAVLFRRFDLRQVAAAQAALDRGESGAAERLAAAEEELERALEAVLDAECTGGACFGGEDTNTNTNHSNASQTHTPKNQLVYTRARALLVSFRWSACFGGEGKAVRNEIKVIKVVQPFQSMYVW